MPWLPLSHREALRVSLSYMDCVLEIRTVCVCARVLLCMGARVSVHLYMSVHMGARVYECAYGCVCMSDVSLGFLRLPPLLVSFGTGSLNGMELPG